MTEFDNSHKDETPFAQRSGTPDMPAMPLEEKLRSLGKKGIPQGGGTNNLATTMHPKATRSEAITSLRDQELIDEAKIAEKLRLKKLREAEKKGKSIGYESMEGM